jgi:hypothetical protein
MEIWRGKRDDRLWSKKGVLWWFSRIHMAVLFDTIGGRTITVINKKYIFSNGG